MEIEGAASIVNRAEQIVFLTGAGVSTASGIPDFRSDAGAWAQIDPERVASIDGFWHSPDEFWGFFDAHWRTLGDYRPNVAHQTIAKWEREGRVAGVVTQNIDGLHQAAGSTVAAVHGTVDRLRCMYDDCPSYLETGYVAWSDVGERERGQQLLCPYCRSALKPDIVLFGEALPEPEWSRAMSMTVSADLMVVVGSSLVVEPVASLPHRFMADPGCSLLVLNREETPADLVATGLLRDDCGETLAAIDRLLG